MTESDVPPDPHAEADDPREVERHRRRLRTFGFHLLGYMLVMAIIVPVNFMTTPGNPWFMLPMVGWAAPLAIHAAYAMGLLDGLLSRPRQ